MHFHMTTQARWFREAVGTVSRTGDRAMQALYLRCSVTLRRAAAPHSNGSGSGANGQPAQQYQYELVVSQDLDDGTYHDADEEAQQETISVQDIVGGQRNSARISLRQCQSGSGRCFHIMTPPDAFTPQDVFCMAGV